MKNLRVDLILIASGLGLGLTAFFAGFGGFLIVMGMGLFITGTGVKVTNIKKGWSGEGRIKRIPIGMEIQRQYLWR